ncbi:hypothetical protein J3B02_001164 [Coemansia erecta]|nr:hypothetical protein J3B02_001164 [Coemansia erecta]
MKFARLIFTLVALIATVAMAAPVSEPIESFVSESSDNNDRNRWQGLGALIRYLIAMSKNKDGNWGKPDYSTLLSAEVEKYNQWYSRYTRTHGHSEENTTPVSAASSTTDVTVVSATPVTPTPVQPTPALPTYSASSSSSQVTTQETSPASEIPGSQSVTINTDPAYTTYAVEELETMVFPSA